MRKRGYRRELTAQIEREIPRLRGTPASSGGGSGAGAAPDDAQYLTLVAHADLTSERVFTPGFGLTATDGGAGAAYDLVVNQGMVPTWTGLHTFNAGITLNGASGANNITIPDNVALAVELLDAGGLEYLRIISTDAQPIVLFNEAGADVDFHVEANGVADALQVQGSDGQITLGALGAGVVQSTAGGVLSSAPVPLTDLASYAEGSLIIGGAADWETLVEPGAAGYALVSDGTTFAWDQTPSWTGHHSFAAGITFNGASGVNNVIVPDNVAIAIGLLDGGGWEYLRIVTTDAQPIINFNSGTRDIDFHVAASGVADALQVQGSDGQITLGALGAGVVQSTAGGVLSSAPVPLTDLASYAEGSLIIGGAADWEALAEPGATGYALVSDGTTFAWDQTPAWTGLHTFAAGITLNGASGANNITIPDNVAIAVELLDAGGVEYLRIISTNAQPIVLFNEAGADVDFHVEANGVADALQVQGADGQITLGALGVGVVQSTAGGVLSSTAVPLVDIAGYAEGSLIIGGAADWETLVEPGATGYALVSDGTTFAWDQTPSWTGLHSFAAGITFNGGSGANDVTIPDNTGIAVELLDAGGLEYLRIVTTDGQPIINFNSAAADVDFHIEASGVADALQIQGSDGQITLGVLGAGFVQSTAGGILSSAAIGAGDLPAHTHSGAGQGGSLTVGTTDTDATAGSVFFAGVAGVIQEDNANLFWDDTNDRLGIGTASPDGTLHVHTASAGVVVADADADDLVVESSGNSGISILVPDGAQSNLYFGSPTDNAGALIRWNHDADLMTIGTANAGGEVAFRSANGVEAIRIDSSQNVGVGIVAPDGTLHVHTASAGAIVADAAADDLVVESSGNSGISILVPDGAQSNLYFGSPSDNIGAMIRWVHNNDLMIIGTVNVGGEVALRSANGVEAVRIDANQKVFVNDTSNASMSRGITINQGANDDEAFACKSSDIAHGMTDVAETDTFGFIVKQDATNGGFRLSGLTEGIVGAEMRGHATTANTVKGTGGGGAVHAVGLLKDGTGFGNASADMNIFAVRTQRGGSIETVAIIDEDGDLHLDAGAGVGGTIHGWVFDEYDDGALLHGLRASLSPEGHELRERFGGFIEYARPVLEAAGVVHYNDGPNEDGRPFVSVRTLNYLLVDAVRQLYEKCQRYELALDRAGLLSA